MKKLLLATSVLYIAFVGHSFAENLLSKVTQHIKSNNKIVKGEQLGREGSMTSAIANVPGVSVLGRDNVNGTIAIRGLSNTFSNMGTRKVSISFDGVGSMSEGYRQPSFFGDSTLYKRADVTVGSGVRVIGGGIAGDVNFVTKDTKDLLKYKTQVNKLQFVLRTNNGEENVAYTHARKFNRNFSGFVNYNYRRSGDIQTPLKTLLHTKNNNDSYLTKINGQSSASQWELKASQYKYVTFGRKFGTVNWVELGYDKGKLMKVKTNDLSAKYTHNLSSGLFKNVTFVASRNKTDNNADGDDHRIYKANQFELLASGQSGANTFNIGIQQRDRLTRELRAPYKNEDVYLDVAGEKEQGIVNVKSKTHVSHNKYGQWRESYILRSKIANEFSKTNKADYDAYNGEKITTGAGLNKKYWKSTPGGGGGDAPTATHAKYKKSGEGWRDSLHGNVKITGVFAENRTSISDKVSLVFGGRIDSAEYKSNTKQAGQAFEWKTVKKTAKTMNAKVLYSVNNNLVLRAGISQADQIFDARDAFYRGRKSIVVDVAKVNSYEPTQIQKFWGSLKDAKLPQLRTYEAGMRYSTGKLTVDGTIYQNRLKNELVRSSGVFNSKTHGFDGTVSYAVTPKLTFGVTYQQVKGKYTSGNKNGSDYSGATPKSGSFRVKYKPKSNVYLTFIAKGQAKGTSYSTSTVYNGYVVYNAYVTIYPELMAKNNGSLKIGIENITNRLYKHYYTSLEGKGVDIQVQLNFDF